MCSGDKVFPCKGDVKSQIMNLRTKYLYFVSGNLMSLWNPMCWLCVCVCVCVCVYAYAMSFQSCLTLCDPMDHSLQGSFAMGFSRQEYCSWFPCLPPGDLLNPGIEPVSLMSPGLVLQNLPANAGGIRNMGSIPESGYSWRRKWQPIPVFLPKEPHEQGSLEGYSPQGHKELDMIEVTQYTKETQI